MPKLVIGLLIFTAGCGGSVKNPRRYVADVNICSIPSYSLYRDKESNICWVTKSECCNNAIGFVVPCESIKKCESPKDGKGQ